jgi:hypothetical protein
MGAVFVYRAFQTRGSRGRRVESCQRYSCLRCRAGQRALLLLDGVR